MASKKKSGLSIFLSKLKKTNREGLADRKKAEQILSGEIPNPKANTFKIFNDKRIDREARERLIDRPIKKAREAIKAAKARKESKKK